MPTYDYFCDKCDKDYEVIKSIKEYDGKDQCPACENIGTRIFSCNIQFIGTKVEDAEYNPAFGKVVKNKYERNELAKKFNVIEIGNENPNKIHANFDKQREEKRKKAYEDI